MLRENVIENSLFVSCVPVCMLVEHSTLQAEVNKIKANVNKLGNMLKVRWTTPSYSRSTDAATECRWRSVI